MRKLPMIDLFSGIGGFSLALRPIARTIAYCEIDLDAIKVLQSQIQKSHLDKARIYRDVFFLKGKDLNSQKPVMMTAGSSCTDVSSLHVRGQGIRGPNSKIVNEVFRLMDEIDTLQVIMLENSNLMLKRGMDEISEAFKRRNFSISYTILAARDVGANHLRKRWWCLAHKIGSTIHLPTILTKKSETEHLQMLSYWQTEPVPRIIPRTSGNHFDTKVRGRLLGNSVVPECVKFSYELLRSMLVNDIHSLKKITSQLFTMRPIIICRAFDDILRTIVVKPSNAEPMPLEMLNITATPKIVLRLFHDQGPSIQKNLWATPVATSWRQCLLKSNRSNKLLANQIFYDIQTQAYIKRSVKKLPQIDLSIEYPQQTSQKWSINPLFIEWLMGYPLEWTQDQTYRC